ncbi:MAG: NERD domain-containing protein [Gaiellaceae bacterium]
MTSPRPINRVVSPPRDELDRRRTPLEPGERLVFDLFDQQLPLEWEIYVQPHLNNLRPDIVLLHPDAGIAVFEVKDWNLAACDWRMEQQNGAPRLIGTNIEGRAFTEANPFERLHQYRTEIADLYCPALNRSAGLASVTAGLIFPFAQDEQLFERFGPGLDHRAPSAAARRYFTLSGASALARKDLDAIFPDHGRRSSWLMTPEIADDLRHWLVEPHFAAEQREVPPLSRDQLRYVNGRTESGFRRLRGPAGSGKTMVVAGRATALGEEKKDVLVVSFNITLLNYLRDSAARFGYDRRRVTWLNFHSWCKRVLYGADMADVYHALPWNEAHADVLDELLASAAAEAIESCPDLVDSYDAILVDEGQDFRPSWWDALRKVRRPDGEMLLVADRAQDVYGRNNLWTDQTMEGAGFRGPWATLDVSYRLPRPLIDLTADFVQRFLDDREITPPIASDQEELDLYPTALRWLQVSSNQLVDAAVEAIRTSIADVPTNGSTPASFANLVFLCDRKELGSAVVARLESLGVRVSHTFSADSRLARQQKLYFFKGDARVKATTIHSFKGWEGSHIVVAAGDAGGQRALSAIYTAMTRLKAHAGGSRLTVVCASHELEPFGRTWPEFERVLRDAPASVQTPAAGCTTIQQTTPRSSSSIGAGTSSSETG